MSRVRSPRPRPITILYNIYLAHTYSLNNVLYTSMRRKRYNNIIIYFLRGITVVPEHGRGGVKPLIRRRDDGPTHDVLQLMIIILSLPTVMQFFPVRILHMSYQRRPQVSSFLIGSCYQWYLYRISSGKYNQLISE